MKLSISGDFKDGELTEIRQKLSQYNIKINRLVVESAEINETVRLCFSYVVDAGIIGIIGNAFYDALKIAINWVKKKKPNAEIQVALHLDFGKNKPNVPIGIPVDNIADFKIQINQILTVEFVDSLKEREAIQISWNKNERKIEMFRMK
jgi:hypothetical protein